MFTKSAVIEEAREISQGSPSTERNSYFPASMLFEYCWPLSDPDAECFMLQEQVSEYLELRAFQRKYPDIQRRSLEYEERKYLVEMGCVTETQSNLGLLAVKSDDVLAVMHEEFPAKYKEYTEHLNQKYMEVAIQQNSELCKQIALSQNEFSREADIQSATKDAVHQVAKYNSKLINQKWSNYYDGQTKIIHQPVIPPVDKGYKVISRYPVALIPGQYQDMYRKYSPDEMKCLPVNTALRNAQVKLHSSVPVSSISMSYATGNVPVTLITSVPSTAINPTTSSCNSQSTDFKHDDIKIANELNTPTRKRPGFPKSLTSARKSRAVLCSVCYKSSNLKGLPESLLYCSKCSSPVHPSCLQMDVRTAKVANQYNWQCLECKTCTICEDPGEEDKMMCCDVCDRGYHSFCVNLKEIPSGHWSCALCNSNHTQPIQKSC